MQARKSTTSLSGQSTTGLLTGPYLLVERQVEQYPSLSKQKLKRRLSSKSNSSLQNHNELQYKYTFFYFSANRLYLFHN